MKNVVFLSLLCFCSIQATEQKLVTAALQELNDKRADICAKMEKYSSTAPNFFGLFGEQLPVLSKTALCAVDYNSVVAILDSVKGDPKLCEALASNFCVFLDIQGRPSDLLDIAARYDLSLKVMMVEGHAIRGINVLEQSDEDKAPMWDIIDTSNGGDGDNDPCHVS